MTGDVVTVAVPPPAVPEAGAAAIGVAKLRKAPEVDDGRSAALLVESSTRVRPCVPLSS